MSTSTRANVVSSFTLIKGTMIPETYAVFAAWDFGRTKRENLARLREVSRWDGEGGREAVWCIIERRGPAKIVGHAMFDNRRAEALASRRLDRRTAAFGPAQCQITVRIEVPADRDLSPS